VSEPAKPAGRPVNAIVKPVFSALNAPSSSQNEDAMKCERCGADMYRMHAVWRCPSCRFKTDCCGW
jgi:rubrerythrin